MLGDRHAPAVCVQPHSLSLSDACGAVQFGHFDFDFVHDQNCGQEDVFYTTVRPLVHKLFEVCRLQSSGLAAQEQKPSTPAD